MRLNIPGGIILTTGDTGNVMRFSPFAYWRNLLHHVVAEEHALRNEGTRVSKEHTDETARVDFPSGNVNTKRCLISVNFIRRR